MSDDYLDQSQRFIESSAEILNAMANPSRLAILSILVEIELSVGALSERIRLSQSALSQHLAKLRGAGLVSFRRDAQTIYYKCNSRRVTRMLAILSEIFDAESAVASGAFGPGNGKR